MTTDIHPCEPGIARDAPVSSAAEALIDVRSAALDVPFAEGVRYLETEAAPDGTAGP